jgi:hypothetical protein
MMTLAVLGAMGWELDPAMVLLETRRPAVDFADVYVESVKRYLGAQKSEVRLQK